MRRVTVLISIALVTSAALSAQPSPAWPDTYVARLQALALMQTLNAEVLAGRSSTRTLETWCRDHRLASDPTITVQIRKGVTRAATAEQRLRLQVVAEEEVKYRRVQLRCGGRILSEAENWYVPGRLSPEMNRLLDATGTPFGKVVQALEPYRQTFEVKLLWSPLPQGWELGSSVPGGMNGTLAIPDALFEHRAVLYTRDHKPFAEVDEVYQKHVLDFPPPR